MNVLECSSTEKMKRLKNQTEFESKLDEDLGEPAGEGNIEKTQQYLVCMGNNVKITIS